MPVSQMFRTIVSIIVTTFLVVSASLATADESDARLQKRIEELENENRALRKIVSEIQGIVKSVPDSPSATAARDLRIVVLPGEWDGSSLVDIRKVCESAGRAFMAHLPNDGFAPIVIERGNQGPITLYKRGRGNEYVMHLDTGGNAWAQLAYQFAHEFCHVVCNYRDSKNPQKWFEETLCECASLYALRQMAAEWQENPPYGNWRSYSSSLASYASDRIGRYDGRSETLAEFYQTNLKELESNGTSRDFNTFIAVKILPKFEAAPASWQTLRYLNLGPVEENKSFEAYLTAWHARVPEQHRPFIRQLASDFGIELANAERSE